MKVLPEYFDPVQFVSAGYDTHFIIKRPYTNFAKSMSIKFEDYYTNLKLQCVIFDKIWTTCTNMYGVKEALRHHRCFETLNYFNQCLKINQFFAQDKKYFPQRYVVSQYHWANPHHDSIHVEPSNKY